MTLASDCWGVGIHPSEVFGSIYAMLMEGLEASAWVVAVGGFQRGVFIHLPN